MSAFSLEFGALESWHCGSLGWTILVFGLLWLAVLALAVRPRRVLLLAWTLTWGFWSVKLTLALSFERIVCQTCSAFVSITSL
jgi:hypothetical protein